MDKTHTVKEYIFCDVPWHLWLDRKYERLREVSEILKKNNVELKTAVQDLNTQLNQKDEKFKSAIQLLEDKFAK